MLLHPIRLTKERECEEKTQEIFTNIGHERNWVDMVGSQEAVHKLEFLPCSFLLRTHANGDIHSLKGKFSSCAMQRTR